MTAVFIHPLHIYKGSLAEINWERFFELATSNDKALFELGFACTEMSFEVFTEGGTHGYNVLLSVDRELPDACFRKEFKHCKLSVRAMK